MDLDQIEAGDGVKLDTDQTLMRDETAPGNSRLSDAQRARLRETGTAHEFLQPRR